MGETRRLDERKRSDVTLFSETRILLFFYFLIPEVLRSIPTKDKNCNAAGIRIAYHVYSFPKVLFAV